MTCKPCQQQRLLPGQSRSPLSRRVKYAVVRNGQEVGPFDDRESAQEEALAHGGYVTSFFV